MMESQRQAELEQLFELYDRSEFEALVERAAPLASNDCADPTIFNLLASAQAALGRYEPAADAFAAALEIEPDDPDANYNLGRALFELGRFDDAATSFGKAIALESGYVEAHYNEGLALFRLLRMEDAEASFRRAIALDPDYLLAHNNLGLVLFELGRIEEAEASFCRALELALVERNADDCLVRAGRLDAAAASGDAALAGDLNLADIGTNLAMLDLLRGDFERGWSGYEWRKKTREPSGERELDTPLWLGKEDLNGKSVVLHSEQGVGDTIQFVRYVPMVKDLGAKVTFASYPHLIPLLHPVLCGIDVIDIHEVPASFDLHAPLMSLPLAFGTRLETIPSVRSYLAAEPSRVSRWAEKLGRDGFKIGICWQCNDRHLGHPRSFPVSLFGKIAALPHVRLISLHKGEGEEQLERLPDGMVVEKPADPFDPPGEAFLDTAALIELCDLVITSDTSVAHLAGALGAPVWVVLKTPSEWRWMRDREDSPWYPSMRLFRQLRFRDWESAFGPVEQALTRVLAEWNKR